MGIGFPTQAAAASSDGAMTREQLGAADTGGPQTIIVIDDDALLGETLVTNLDEAGYKARWFSRGSDALDHLPGNADAAAVLLDWSMPDMDGAEVLRRLRLMGYAGPIIILTGHGEPMFEEAALAGGAIDFVEKTRSFSIVLQRLKLALAGAKGQPDVGNEPSCLKIDEASARAFWKGQLVDLTITEFKVIRLLAANPDRDVPYRALYDLVRGEGFQAGSGADGYRANVRAIVKRVRRAFCTIDPQFDAIENYPGFGYRWSSERAHQSRTAAA
jgi:two-component system response regulator ChvI